MSSTMKLLGDEIRIKRLTRRFSQAEVAKAIGVKQASLSHVENGRIKISSDKLLHLVRLLDLDLAKIVVNIEVMPMLRIIDEVQKKKFDKRTNK